MAERRYDPTVDEWVTFAADRQHRTYKPTSHCPLCPTRPGGPPTEIPLPEFEVVTFDNRFPSFSPAAAQPAVPDVASYRSAPAVGRCEVVVYSDDHEATFSDLPPRRVRLLVDVWADRWQLLAAEPAVAYVMPFENKGEVIGTTLSHPHGQIYAYPDIPPRVRSRLEVAVRHQRDTGRCVHCDVVAAEVADGARVVVDEGGWIAWVPYWARFPFELNVAPRRHVSCLPDLAGAERDGLARTLRTVTRAYDALWGFSLPYTMAFYSRPADAGAWEPAVHLSLDFSPPNRTPTKLKYLAGSELQAGAYVTDVMPEDAAAQLRAAVRRAGR